jgi:hypothetical protein
MFEWELAKAKGSGGEQLAEKEAKKAAAAEVERQPTTLAEQVEQLVAQSVSNDAPQAHNCQTVWQQHRQAHRGGNNKGKGGQQQQQVKQQGQRPAAAPKTTAPKIYLDAAAGPNRCRSRCRFYLNKGGRGGGTGGNQGHKGANSRQQQRQPAAA